MSPLSFRIDDILTWPAGTAWRRTPERQRHVALRPQFARGVQSPSEGTSVAGWNFHARLTRVAKRKRRQVAALQRRPPRIELVVSTSVADEHVRHLTGCTFRSAREPRVRWPRGLEPARPGRPLNGPDGRCSGIHFAFSNLQYSLIISAYCARCP